MVLICISLISCQADYILHVHLTSEFSGSVVQRTIRNRRKNLMCVAVHSTHMDWVGTFGLRVCLPLVRIFPWVVLTPK